MRSHETVNFKPNLPLRFIPIAEIKETGRQDCSM